MSVLAAFWFALSLALGLAVLTVFLLRRSLQTLLIEVCGTRTRATFWTLYSSIAVVLTAFLGMLASFPLSEGREWADFPWFPSIVSAFRLSLLFLLIALGGLGLVLLVGIGSYESRRRFEASTIPPIVGTRAPTTLQV